MKTTMLAILTIALLTCFVTTGPIPVLAEPTGSSTMGGGNMPDPHKAPKDKQYGDIVSVIDTVKGAGAQPIGLQIDYLQ